jgi:hypothetical protein
MANKVYNLTLQNTVLANQPQASNFRINNYNRDFILKSICYNIYIRETVTHEILPEAINTTQDHSIYMNAFPVASGFLIGNPFADLALFAGTTFNNATQIFLNKPGQINFESFYIVNSLIFYFFYINRDLLLSYDYIMQLIVETSET